MKIQAFTSRGVHVVSVAGEIASPEEGAELVRSCEAALDSGVRNLVLDLSELEWLDSTGIGAVVRCAKRTAKKDATLKIVVVLPGPVEATLALAQLDRVFEVFDDLGSAVGSFPY